MSINISSIHYCPVKSISFQSVKNCKINKNIGLVGDRVFAFAQNLNTEQVKLFEQSPDEDLLKSEINTQLKVHIPEITLLDVLVNFLSDQNLLLVKIIYRFNLDGSNDSIQLNFNE